MRRPRAVVVASFLPKLVMRIVKFQPITEWNRFCGLIANDRKDPSDLDEFNGFGAWSVFYAVLSDTRTHLFRMAFRCICRSSNVDVWHCFVCAVCMFVCFSLRIYFKLNVALCPQRPLGLLGTWSPGRPHRLSHNS